jgi:hypothetical protein
MDGGSVAQPRTGRSRLGRPGGRDLERNGAGPALART